MGNVYGAALKKLLSDGVAPETAIKQLVLFLTQASRTRDILPALTAARSRVQAEMDAASILVTEVTINSISDEQVRTRVHALITTPIIRKLDPTLSAGWIIKYRGVRIDASAKHQLNTWYQSARTRI